MQGRITRQITDEIAANERKPLTNHSASPLAELVAGGRTTSTARKMQDKIEKDRNKKFETANDETRTTCVTYVVACIVATP